MLAIQELANARKLPSLAMITTSALQTPVIQTLVASTRESYAMVGLDL
jgi:hypothetical protein